MIKTKKTHYHRGSKVDEIVEVRCFMNKPEIAELKVWSGGYYSFVSPDSLVETKEGEIKRAIQKVCNHKHRTPFTNDQGVNYIICTICNKSWGEGELCERKKK